MAKEKWGSKLGVILAVTGSAVGLGNFLRFPGVACANGGGAFMIPYIIAFILLGLPIAWVEWAMGRYGGRNGFSSAPGIFRAITGKNRTAQIGTLAVIIPVIIYMYYVSIEGWCLGYAWKYWTGGMDTVVAEAQLHTAAEQPPATTPETEQLQLLEQKEAGINATKSYLLHFAGIVAENDHQKSGNLRILREFGQGSMPFLLICFAVNFFLIYRGINRGIEWFCRWAMPALVVCALIILVRVLTLGTPNSLMPEASISNGLGFMWNPVGHNLVNGDLVEVGFWEALSNPQTWLAAAGQIFFSLSVGFGVILTYASYTKENDDIALSSLSAASGNGFFEVALGGMIVIPAAFVFLGPTSIISAGEKASSLSLGFFALPGVFENMPAGHFFGGLFFFLLFIAAVTSSLSMLQPAIAFLEEGLGLGRHASVTLLGFITATGALFVSLVSDGLVVLDHLDFWTANFCIFLLATIEVIFFSWIMGLDRGLKELAHGAEIRLPKALPFVLKYITPAFLLIIFGSWLSREVFSNGPYIKALKENSIVQLTLAFILANYLFFAILVHIAVQRWKKIERNGKEVEA
ncbi:MAG: sodium-dependent transporter [Pontiellaceae bacterium]|nr:sodium-dependent transporter [Pontiellaceae bacterium]MBN2784492.1 sodium-dependent transporter [Pontiellaceae bacterium]